MDTGLGRIEVDAADWPVLRVKLPVDVSTDETTAYLDFASELRYRKPGPFVVVLEGPDRLTDRTRAILEGDMARTAEEGDRSRCLGVAIVVPSALQRGLLTASLTVRKSAWPLKAVSNAKSGVRWCRRQLKSSDVINEEADSLVGSIDDIDEPPTMEMQVVPIPDSDGRHLVEVGKFASERRAHLRAQTMLDQGIIAVVTEIPSLHRPTYHVRIGPYASPQRAKSARDALSDIAPDAVVVQV
jgi:hypothetical protein